MDDVGHAPGQQGRVLRGPHEQRHAGARPLRSRGEDGLTNGSVEGGPDAADHADNRPLHVVSFADVVEIHAQPAAQGIFARELLPYELLADDDDRR
jgi:hypothetical protein